MSTVENAPETKRSAGVTRKLARFTIDGVTCLAYSFAEACELVRGPRS